MDAGPAYEPFLKEAYCPSNVHSVILTEMGIMVRDGKTHARSFPFQNGAQGYLDAKSGKGRQSHLVQFLASAGVEVQVSDAGLLATLAENGIDAVVMDRDDIDAIQDAKPAILVEGGFATSEHDARGKLRQFALEMSSLMVAEISQTPDLHIIQAINSLDETDKIANSLFARLREWYGLHFPELENLVDGISGYCKIALAGRRDELDAAVFAEAGFPESKVEMLNLVARTSRGGSVSDENLARITALARQVLELYETRRDLEEHIEAQMREAAPNLTAIMGAGVGARLLARAGSLKRLATMAASTIQILGAEKALFRSLKTGSQPPKHGLIFQHAMVHRAPRWQRGKIARAVASKAAIAARMDMHEPALNETLLERLNVRVDEIGKRYAEPPPKPADTDYRSGGAPPRAERRPKAGKKGGRRRDKKARRESGDAGAPRREAGRSGKRKVGRR